jgi:hypothetical protein
MTTQQAVRRWIMTGAVAAVTITGTIYGAQLKSGVDVKKARHFIISIRLPTNHHASQTKKRVLETTPEERIAQLEVARQDLVAKKHEMERKITMFHERRIREKGQAEPK